MLSKTLRAILETSAENSSATGPSLSLLREVWPTLLGEPLCHRTRPSSWDDGTLVVGVASEAWLGEMRRNKRRLHRRISARLPWQVDALTFVVEDLPASPHGKGSRAGSGADGAAAQPAPLPDDDPASEDLDRLDPQTKDLVLRIRHHLQSED